MNAPQTNAQAATTPSLLCEAERQAADADYISECNAAGKAAGLALAEFKAEAEAALSKGGAA